MKNHHGIISEFKYYLLESFSEALSKMLIFLRFFNCYFIRSIITFSTIFDFMGSIS